MNFKIIGDSEKMEEVSVEDRKKISVEILDVINSFCKGNNIRCYLHAGTLLGAVRHKGFIPWDDDVDVCMPRPDYEKFLSVFNSEHLYISNYRTSRRYTQPFSKVCSDKTCGKNLVGKKLPYGIGVDIFPIDGFPADEKNIDKFFNRQYKIFDGFYIRALLIESNSIRTFNPLKFLFKLFFRLFVSSGFAAKIVDNDARKNAFEQSEFAGCSVALYRCKIQKARRESFDSAVNLKFEDKEYPCPAGYDDVLKSIYGTDYMTPPPENKRKTTHTEIYYWTE